MSKIFGIISTEYDKDTINRSFNNMQNSFFYSKEMDHQIWNSNNAWLGRLSNGSINCETQPISIRNKHLIFAGHLLDYQMQKMELINNGSEFKYKHNDAEYLLNYLDKKSAEKINSLNGIFAAALWEEDKKKVLIINDRYGFKPLYYYNSPSKKTFIFSSEIRPIIMSGMVDKKVNWEAWNVFLRLDFMLGDHTFFKNVFRLPPASVLTFDTTGKINLETYWTLNKIPSLEECDLDQIVARMYELYKNSVSKYLKKIDKKVWITMSGGHDSRWLAAELKSQKVTYKAFTTRKFNPYIDDIESSKLVAKHLNISHEIVDLPNDFIKQYEMLKNRIMDYESDENYYLIPMFEKVPADYKFCFSGTGDVAINGYFYSDYWSDLMKRNDYRSLAKDLLRKRGLGYLRKLSNHICKDRDLKCYFNENVAIDMVESELRRYENCLDPVTTFYLYNRTRREASLTESNIYIGKSENFSPYLENDCFDYLMSIPLRAKSNRRILDEVIRKYYHKLHRIPFPYFMDEAEQSKYYSNNLEIEEQLSDFCVKLVNQIKHKQISWISSKWSLFTYLLLFAEKHTNLISYLVNKRVKHSTRRYRFPRYFTSYSVLRMIAMLDAWINDYEIDTNFSNSNKMKNNSKNLARVKSQ